MALVEVECLDLVSRQHAICIWLVAVLVFVELQLVVEPLVERHNIQECMMGSMLVHMLHIVHPLPSALDIVLHTVHPLAFVLDIALVDLETL